MRKQLCIDVPKRTVTSLAGLLDFRQRREGCGEDGGGGKDSTRRHHGWYLHGGSVVTKAVERDVQLMGVRRRERDGDVDVMMVMMLKKRGKMGR